MPVECGGVLVEPGDYIAADVNGIIVMKPSEVEDIIKGAEAKIEAESKTLAYMKERAPSSRDLKEPEII